MRKHSRRPKALRVSSNSRQSKSKPTSPPSEEVLGFVAAFQQLLPGASMPTGPKRRGKPPRVRLGNLRTARGFPLRPTAGTFSEPFGRLLEDALCDSACSDRRARLPWPVLADLMRQALRPLAPPRRHAESFWHD